jgi:hypothetical protein
VVQAAAVLARMAHPPARAADNRAAPALALVRKAAASRVVRMRAVWAAAKAVAMQLAVPAAAKAVRARRVRRAVAKHPVAALAAHPAAVQRSLRSDYLHPVRAALQLRVYRTQARDCPAPVAVPQVLMAERHLLHHPRPFLRPKAVATPRAKASLLARAAEPRALARVAAVQLAPVAARQVAAARVAV